MSRFDIPASLLYVLKTTEQEKLSYIGISLVCTLFFHVMIGLATVSTLDDVNVTIRLLAAFWHPIQVRLGQNIL